MNYFDFDPVTFHGCYSMQSKEKWGWNWADTTEPAP